MANSKVGKAFKNDFQKINSEADFEIVLKSLGLWENFKPSKNDPNQLRGKCPFFCDPATKEKDDFSISVKDKVWRNFDKTCRCCVNQNSQT